MCICLLFQVSDKVMSQLLTTLASLVDLTTLSEPLNIRGLLLMMTLGVCP